MMGRRSASPDLHAEALTRRVMASGGGGGRGGGHREGIRLDEGIRELDML